MIRSRGVGTVGAFLLCAVLVIAPAGCAVLTESQVAEVKKFAEASEDYSELPGALIRAYGTLSRDAELLAISGRQFDPKDTQGNIDPRPANEAWDGVKNAYTLEQEFAAIGKQMDAAIAVLREYSAILTSLTADSYTDALGEQAAKLGKSLDDATKSYNDTFKPAKQLPSVGGAVAEGIRAAGGLYIRHRQAVALRKTVEDANELIDALMDEVKIIAKKQQEDFMNAEENSVGQNFKETARNSGRLAVTTLARVYDDFAAAKIGQQLAQQVEHSAATYQKAHRELVNKTRQRTNLREIIAEIEALEKEVKAAKATKEKVEK